MAAGDPKRPTFNLRVDTRTLTRLRKPPLKAWRRRAMRKALRQFSDAYRKQLRWVPEPGVRVYVFARNHHEFEIAKRRGGLPPRAMYIGSVEDLRGVPIGKKCRSKWLGNWRANPVYSPRFLADAQLRGLVP